MFLIFYKSYQHCIGEGEFELMLIINGFEQLKFNEAWPPTTHGPPMANSSTAVALICKLKVSEPRGMDLKKRKLKEDEEGRITKKMKIR